MKLELTNAIKYAVACLAGGALTPCLSTAQLALPGDLDPAGRVYTQIVARVGEQGSNSPPITGLTVYVVSEDGRRLTLRTNAAGTVATWLARARYRLVTPEPFQLEGRMYTWDTITAVRPGMSVIRLQLANAKSQLVPIVTWSPDDRSSNQTLKDGHTVRTLSRDGVAISATMIRKDDLMWADVTISNRSNRRLDVDPQTFAMNQLSPKQTPLRYLSPTDISNSLARRARIVARRGTKSEDILNRALTANTLMPGQDIAGAVFFERDKEAHDVMLRIPLSGVTFDVPLSIR